MDSSYTLLTLPQPLDATHGRTQSSVVFSLQGSKKRKRDELVVGVDGEAINIYEIQKQSIQTSYAIPPSAYLCCRPISVHTHGELGAQRDTLAILRDGPEDRKRRLVRFQERYSGTAEFMAPSKKEFTLPQGDICAVHALPSQTVGATFAPQSLVTYNNGEVLCVSEDLSKVAWRSSLLEGEGSGAIEAVFLGDVESARRGILHSREDIAATLPFEDKLTSVACFVTRQASHTLLRLCAIHSGSARGGLRQLGDVQLKTSAPAGASTWELCMETGQLCQLHNGILHIFDLTGIIPRLSLTISEKTNRFHAVKHISKSLVLALSAHRATLYDSQYGSIQGVVALSTSTSTTGKKRKRGGTATSRHPDLHWISDLRTAIVSSDTLVGIPLKAELALSTKESIRLASVIGKSATVQANEEIDNEESEAWRQQVEGFIAADDATGLEQAIATSFGIDAGLPAPPDAMSDEPAEYILWDLSSEALNLGVNQKARALEVLQRLFSVQSTSLRLQLTSRNILRWLFAVELVTTAKLSSIYGSDIDMKHVADALVEADPSFQLVFDILTLGVHLPVEFSVACLKLLIRSLDTVPTVNGAATVTGDDEVDHEAQAAEAELSNALLTLQSGLELRSATMQLLFGRLHAFSRKILTKALKTGLELRDLVFFVHLLRIELADAGWTRSYVNDIEDHTDDDATPYNGAIRTIGNLMVAAVDAMGPAGWLVGLKTDEDEQVGLIDALRAEIGASLAGVYEAQLLKATLDDFERFTMLKDTQTSISLRPQIEVQSTAEESSYLPMGGRSSIVASQRKTAIKRTGEMVGAYQFERIRV